MNELRTYKEKTNSQLERLGHLLANISYEDDSERSRKTARELLGDKGYVKYILQEGWDLSDEDKALVVELLSE